MLKFIFKFYVTFVFVLATVMCRFSGDSCVADGEEGICTDLSLCQPLQVEIQAAGSPLPHFMAHKLQQITCGYNSYGPLVCCVDTWSPTEMGLPNRKKTTPSDNDNYPIWGSDDKKGTLIDRPNSVDPGDDKRTVVKNGDGPADVAGHPNLDKLPTDCGSMDAFRISGGNRTALYEMPWMVLLSYNTTRENKLNCGGTLINEWYVLTAAHCVAFLGNKMRLESVILGEWDVRTDPDCEQVEGTIPTEMQEACAPRKRNVAIASVIAHPGHSPQTLFDDIALIRLAEPADFSLDTMAPICLPVTRELQRADLVGQTGVVAGWGVTEIGLQSPVLLSVGLPIIANNDCQAAYRGSPRVYDKQMCAGGEVEKDSCGGDSGGPLMFPGSIRSGGIKYVQRGIVSYGSKRCGVGGLPGVYTRVAYYMDWILNNIS